MASIRRSHTSPPASVCSQRRMATTSTTVAPSRISPYWVKNSLVPMSRRVEAGRVMFTSVNICANFGMTKVMQKIMVARPMTRMMAG